MKVRHALLVTLVSVMLHSGVWADESVVKMPGYVDFAVLAIPKDLTPTGQMELEGPLLQAAMAQQQDTTKPSKGKQWLSKLTAMRIQTYSLEQRPKDDYEARIDSLLARLRAAGWKTLLGASNPGNRAYIGSLPSGDRTVGLVEIAYNKGNSLSLINLVGEIDMELIEMLSSGSAGAPLNTLDSSKRESTDTSKVR